MQKLAVLLAGTALAVACSDHSTSTTVSTATPTQSVQATQTIGGDGALPPTQTWCPSSIYCAGPILHAMNLAKPFADSKTIVDKPTNKGSVDVVDDFNNLLNEVGGQDNEGNLQTGKVVQFIENDFVSTCLCTSPTSIFKLK